MAVKFQLIGTQLKANYAKAWGSAAQISSSGHLAAIVANAASGVFGGSVIDISNDGSGSRPLVYSGADNMPLATGAFSILVRIVPTWSGNPTASQAIFQSASGDGLYKGSILFGINTNGTMNVLIQDEHGNSVVNNPTTTALTFVAGQPTDIWVVWNGASGANVLVYQAQNGAAAAQVGTALTALVSVSSRTAQVCGSFVVGDSPQFTSCNFTVNELVIFDTAENPPGYGIRTGFLTVPQNNFEGYDQTDPGVANVLAPGSGGPSSYVFQGATLVGTYVPPVNTSPGTANVARGTTWTYNGVQQTGTLFVDNPRVRLNKTGRVFES